MSGEHGNTLPPDGRVPMDHAAAHERIEDLILEPARLAELPASTAPDDLALREHLAGCPACAADLDTWRRLQAAIDGALPEDPALAAAAVQPIEPPIPLRDLVLASVREAAQPAQPGPLDPPAPLDSRVRARRLAPWMALAASVIVIVGAVGITVTEAGRRVAAQADAQELAAALAIVDRMLATDHKVVQLTTTAGAPAGTISWSRHDWVVLTTALPEPPSGQEYLCWLEADGRNVPVGHMEFAGGTAYWVATLDEWQTWEIGPTTMFVVTLEPAGSQTRTGPAILQAALAS